MYGPPSPETKLLFLHKINWTLEIELSYSNRNKLTIVKSLSKSDTFATSCILWEVNKNIERLFITLGIWACCGHPGTSLVAQMVKNSLAMQETWVRSLRWDLPLEKGTATHSSILAWRISWTEEPDGLQFMESWRVRHD